MKLRLLFSIALFEAAAETLLVRGQSPVRVTACDLADDPDQYAGQVVEVREMISLHFEDFTLAAAQCKESSRPIWLIYGGDEPTPTASTVNDLSRKPDTALKVNGRAIPLVHDANLDLFRRRLDALRSSPIGDRPCYDCYLYHVTATLTGVFFAAPKDEHAMNGYGHMGCCHLLAIQQVSDVEAERTAIPMGGTFQCATEKRTLDPVEANRLKAFEKSCVGLTNSECRDLRLQQVAGVAADWNDKIQPEDGTLTGGEIDGNTSKQSWVSADKLKSYSVEIQSDSPLKDASKATGGVITRQICTAATPPLPMSALVDCRRLRSEFPLPRADVKAASRRVVAGDETSRIGSPDSASRLALTDAAKSWHMELSKEFLPVECEKPMVNEGDQFSWCNWISRDGLQSFSIQVTRFGYLRHGRGWDSVPWFLTRGSGLVCSVAP